MNEATIRAFFEGTLGPVELDRGWASAFVEEPRSDGTVVRRLRTIDLPEPYAVAPSHIVALIDAVRTGALSFKALDAICFALEASDSFEWDTETPEGEHVARSVFWLGSPEVNYPLTPGVLTKIRRYVLTGEDTFTRDDLRTKANPARAINIKEPKRGA